MAASVGSISAWFDTGVAQGSTHMIVVCDSFDWEDYPVYVTPSQDVRERMTDFDGKNMQRIMEVYNLSMDKEKQLSEFRAFHY